MVESAMGQKTVGQKAAGQKAAGQKAPGQKPASGPSGRRGRRGPRQDSDDVAVSLALGERVRQRRGLLGLSQQELGRRVGLTFQQVQKYERGLNRISVPALVKIAAALETTPAVLLDGLGAPPAEEAPESGLLDREAMALLGASRQLPDVVRRAMLDLARTMAGSDLVAPAAGTGATAAPEAPVAERRRPGRPRRTDTAATAASGETGEGGAKARRRRGAVWDPSDIERAARPR